MASSEEALTHLDSGLAYPRPLHPEALTCASSEQPLTFTPTTTSTGARREGIDTECAGGQLLESSGARARDELISAQRPKSVEAEVEEAAGAGRDKGPVAGAATAPQDKLPLERQKNLCHGSSASSAHTHADDHQVLPVFLYYYICVLLLCGDLWLGSCRVGCLKRTTRS